MSSSDFDQELEEMVQEEQARRRFLPALRRAFISKIYERPVITALGTALGTGMLMFALGPTDITIGDVTGVSVMVSSPLVVLTRSNDIRPSSAVSVIFQCDWPNVGTTTETQCKTQNWNFGGGDPTVAVATDLGLPATWPNNRAFVTYCMRRADGGCTVQNVGADLLWNQPQIGDVWAYRVTLTVTSEQLSTGNLNANEHSYSTTPGGGSQATVYLAATQQTANNLWSFSMHTQYATAGAAFTNWCLTDGPGGCNGGNRIYFPGYTAVEVHNKFTFLSDTSYIAEARVYDLNGVLLYDNDDFFNTTGSTSLPYTVTVNATDPWNWNYLRIGSSAINPGELDQATFGNYGGMMTLWGGFALCKGDWCPHYGGLPEDN